MYYCIVSSTSLVIDCKLRVYCAHTQLTHSKKSKAWSMTAHGYRNQDPNALYLYFSCPGILCSIWFTVLFFMLSLPTKTTIENQTTYTSSLEERETLSYVFCSWWNFTVDQLRKIQPNKVSLPSLSVSTEEWLHLPSSHDLLHPIGTYMASSASHQGILSRLLLLPDAHHCQMMGLLWWESLNKFPNRQVNKYCSIVLVG
jgi:hypothetical protein